MTPRPNEIFTGEGARIVDVSPEMASDLLARANFDNRKLRPSTVAKYAKMMRSGEWLFSPETISIANSGRLLNGQHRLNAVVASGVTTRFLFATGFDEAVFKVIDRGVGRTRADALKADRKLLEVANLAVRLRGGSSGMITDNDVALVAGKIGDEHSALMETCGRSTKVFSSAPFRLACIARVMSGADRDEAFDLYRGLVLGHTESLPNVGHAAMRAVMRGRLRAGGGATQLDLASTAWNIFDPRSRMKAHFKSNRNPRALEEILEAIG